MTTNHEMAHQMGFGEETECNFIDSSIKKNDDLYIQYSGTAMPYGIASICGSTDEKSFDQILTVHPEY
jgi:hypothetical protein